jgi:hypothetical protein
LFSVPGYGAFRFQRDWSGANGNWESNNSWNDTDMHHVAVTYNGGATTNDPVFYVDGVGVSTNEIAAPTGTLQSDAAEPLIAGEIGNGTQDWSGLLGFLNYDNSIWDAEQVNRAKWWGTQGGASKCYYPMLTDAVNRGTATANGSVTGAVLTSLPRVERNWGACMGVGR